MSNPAPASTLNLAPESSRRIFPPAAPLALLLSILAGFAIVLGGAMGAMVFVIGLISIPLLTRPFLALNLLVAVAAFDAINTLAPSSVYALTGSKLLGYVLAAAVAFDLAFHQVRFRFDLSILLLGVLGLLIVMSFWSAARPDLVLTDGLRFAQLGILFLAVRQLVTTQEHLRTLAKTLVASLLLSAAIAFVEAFSNPDRIAGVSQNAAVLAAELLVGLAFMVGLVSTTGRGAGRTLLYIGMALLGTVLVMTETRAAFLAMIPAGMIVYMAVGRRNKLFGFVTIAVLISFIAFGGIMDRMMNAVAVADNSTKGHLHTLLAGSRMLADHPALGVGLGNFPVHYLSYSNDTNGLPKTAHNSYLSFAAEMGIPGLFFWPVVILACAVPLYRAARSSALNGNSQIAVWHQVVLFALVGLATMSIFHTLHFSKYMWLLLALAAQAPSIMAPAEEEDEAEDGETSSPAIALPQS